MLPIFLCLPRKHRHANASPPDSIPGGFLSLANPTQGSLTLADGSKPKILWEANCDWRSIAALAKENLAISQGQNADSRASVIAA